jgi:hypothetical protein
VERLQEGTKASGQPDWAAYLVTEFGLRSPDWGVAVAFWRKRDKDGADGCDASNWCRMRVGAPDELSAVLLAERLGRDRCRIGQQSDDSWYLEFNRPPTPGPVAELLAEVRRWLAAERIAQTIVWIGEQPFAVSG